MHPENIGTETEKSDNSMLENNEGMKREVDFILAEDLVYKMPLIMDNDAKAAEFVEDFEAVTVYKKKEELEGLLSPLIDKGIKISYEGWTSDGDSGDDWAGTIYIKKDELNKALKEGILKIIVSEDNSSYNLVIV